MAILKRNEVNQTLPLYLQLEKIIRGEVSSGKIKPGAPLPREEELCRAYKVSSITVKRALRDLTREGLLIRIQSKGTFVRPEFVPKLPAPKQTLRKVMALVVPDIEDAFIREIYKGVEAVASQHGYLVAVQTSDRDVVRETRNIELLKEGMADGALIFPNWGRFNANQILNLKKAGFPFVLIDRFFRDIKTDMVTVDNLQGAQEAVKYLLDLGHRRIAHIMGAECTANEDRFEGYLKALSAAGISYNPSLVRKIQPFELENSIRFEPDDIGGYDETLALIKQEPRPTAIFAGNDHLALGCLKALKDRKIRVPQDIAVFGFDDLKFSAQLEVPLSTVSQPKFEIGKESAEILLRRIQEKDRTKTPEYIHALLKTRLIIRATTGQQPLPPPDMIEQSGATILSS